MPRRRSSSATKCGVRNSRRLPRWIGPDGLAPEATVHPVALARVPDRVVGGAGHPVDGVSLLSAVVPSCCRFSRSLGDGRSGKRYRAVRSAGSAAEMGRAPEPSPAATPAPCVPDVEQSGPHPRAGDPAAKYGRGRCRATWLAGADGTNLPRGTDQSVSALLRAGPDREPRNGSTAGSLPASGTRSRSWPRCCSETSEELLAELVPAGGDRPGRASSRGPAGGPAHGDGRCRAGPARSTRGRGVRQRLDTLAGCCPHLWPPPPAPPSRPRRAPPTRRRAELRRQPAELLGRCSTDQPRRHAVAAARPVGDAARVGRSAIAVARRWPPGGARARSIRCAPSARRPSAVGAGAARRADPGRSPRCRPGWPSSGTRTPSCPDPLGLANEPRLTCGSAGWSRW